MFDLILDQAFLRFLECVVFYNIKIKILYRMIRCYYYSDGHVWTCL